MEDCSFDGFLDGLHDALVRAQDAGRRRRERLLRRRFGDFAEQTLGFPIQTLDAAGWRTERVALLDLLQRHHVGISRLELDLACDLRVERAADGEARVVVLVRKGARAQAARHRLRVILRGIDKPEGEVIVDGCFLRRFGGASRVPASAPRAT